MHCRHGRDFSACYSCALTELPTDSFDLESWDGLFGTGLADAECSICRSCPCECDSDDDE